MVDHDVLVPAGALAVIVVIGVVALPASAMILGCVSLEADRRGRHRAPDPAGEGWARWLADARLDQRLRDAVLGTPDDREPRHLAQVVTDAQRRAVLKPRPILRRARRVFDPAEYLRAA